MIRVRKVKDGDMEYLVEHLRKEDIAEIRKMGGTEREAVFDSVSLSDETFALAKNGVPMLLFGIVGSLVGTAKVWALGTDVCHTSPKVMLKWGRRWSDKFVRKYGPIENWCDADYTSSLKWLRKIGFRVDEPENGFCHIIKEA